MALTARAAHVTVVRVLTAACVLVFLGLVVGNYRLRLRIRVLEDSLRRAQRLASSRVVRAGEAFESLRVLDTSGGLRLLEARGSQGGALVAVVDPRCGSCEAVAAEIKGYVGAKAGRPVWLLSLADAEATRDFAARHQLSEVTYRLPEDANAVLRQRLSSAPQVFLVDGQERVTRTCETVAECASPVAGPAVAATSRGAGR